MDAKLRCVGCGYYEEELKNGPCEAYDLQGHRFIEVDEKGFAIIAPENLHSVSKRDLQADSSKHEAMRRAALGK